MNGQAISADERWNRFADLSVRFMDEVCQDAALLMHLKQKLNTHRGQRIDCQYNSGDQ